MSIFSKIKGASKAAKEHKKAKAKEPAGHGKDAPIPYRHIPTHAAIDALSGTPSSWREEDRTAIKAQHKRRSMMSRNDSGISSTFHRNSSYGFHGGAYNYSHHGSEYGVMMPGRLDARKSYLANNTYQPSPLNSHGVSPAVSEANSTSSSSSQLIEIPYAGNRTSEINVLDNIPRSTKRKLGEAPLWTHPPPTVVKNQPPVISAPEAKKRSWGFRRTNPTPAVAVH